MPLVVRYVEPRRERYPSTKQGIPRARAKADESKTNPTEMPEEYQSVDKLLTVTSCLPILETVSTNQLQAITIHRISSLMRQLSSLAQHAESIMGEITESLVSCHTRSVQLGARIKRLTEEILPSLDPELEAMEGFEIPHPDFQFKSRKEANQLTLSKHPPPPPLVLTIQATHTPLVHLFSEFWPDGRNAKHMYSNPDYFFEQWRISVQKGAFRRKSSGHILSPTSPTGHSKSNGIPGGRHETGRVASVGRSTKLRRSATVVSRSSKKKPRPLSYHSSSTLSLQDVGLSSSSKPKSKGFQRTYSMRVSSGAAKKGIKIPKSKHLAEPLSKSIAAVFPQIEITSAEGRTPDKDLSRSDTGKFQRGSGLRRSFSLRRSRSRSKSPHPPSGSTSDSVPSVPRNEDSSSSDLSVPPKKQTELLEPGTTGPSSTSSTENAHKASTFLSSSSLLNRSVTPLLTRVSTPPNGQVGRGRQRTSSDARELTKSSVAQRSLTVSGAGSPNLRNVAARVRAKIKNEGRPASMSLDVHIDGKAELNGKTTSQSSLVNVRTSSSQSNSSGSSSRPRSMLVGDIDIPLSQELSSKMSANNQSRKPRRPAPPRPTDQDGSEWVTPDLGRKGRTTPTFNASPIFLVSPDAVKADSNNSSPISTFTSSVEKTGTDSSPEKGQHEMYSEQKGPPPPPPQRNDSLSSLQKTAHGPVAGSGPATPGVARTAQVHSTLDAAHRQSVATALTEVLSNMSRRSFLLSPTSPPPLINGDLNKTLTPDKSTPPYKTLSPVDKTPQNGGVIDLNATLTPFDGAPHFQMSPINAASPRSPTLQTGTFGSSSRGTIPPSKRRFSKRQSSLYISPHKLTEVSADTHRGFSHRADQILKAGGVESVLLEDSRSDLLTAIRKGIRLKKVDGEASQKNDEVSWDVAAILERYEVLHSDSDEDSEYGDDEWLDD